LDLPHQQSNLPNAEDCVDIRIIEQSTRTAVEHKLKETSEKSGEPATPGESREVVVSDATSVETFLEVRTEGRQGNREKRQPLVFIPIRDCFEITAGACVTPSPRISEDLLQKTQQAFQSAS
jgi:hypothetical protein